MKNKALPKAKSLSESNGYSQGRTQQGRDSSSVGLPLCARRPHGAPAALCSPGSGSRARPAGEEEDLVAAQVQPDFTPGSPHTTAYCPVGLTTHTRSPVLP